METANRPTKGKPIHISPVTLLARYPPVVISVAQRLSPPTDVRQSTDFTANWTRKTIDARMQAGVAFVTFYETHGPRGLVDNEHLYLCAHVLGPDNS